MVVRNSGQPVWQQALAFRSFPLAPGAHHTCAKSYVRGRHSFVYKTASCSTNAQETDRQKQQQHTHYTMADLDDIEDMIGEEELSRAAMDATREPMVAPKNAIGGGGNGGAQSASADTGASVPGTQLIW